MELHKARYKYRQETKKNKRSKLLLILISLVLFTSAGGYSAAALSKEYSLNEPTILEYPTSIPEKIDINWPEVGQAAFGATDTGLIDSTDNEKVQPIASITKLVTALTVLKENPIELGEVGDVYVMNSTDERLFDNYISKLGSVVPVRAGQKLTQYDMLNALLLPSANNIADSLVIRTFGSHQKFLEAANTYVSSLGLQQTIISDASGFSPKSVSTPSEILIIASEALKDPVLAEIMTKKTYNFPGWGEINNSNLLLGNRKGVVGLKTGTTDEAGYCLVFAQTYTMGEDKTTIVGSILGSNSRAGLYNDTNKLLDSVEKGFKKVSIIKKGSSVAKIDSVWGESTDVVSSEDLSVFGWAGESYQTEISLKPPLLSVVKGEELGVINVGGSSSSVKLTAEKTISEPSVWWRYQNVF